MTERPPAGVPASARRDVRRGRIGVDGGAMSSDLRIPSIATTLDRAWQRYRIEAAEAEAHPNDRTILRRDAAREAWLALPTRRIRGEAA